MKSLFALSVTTLIFLSSCSPSEAIIQTAISKTEEARLPLPAIETTKSSSELPTPITPKKTGFVIGGVRYQIPSGSGWCVIDKTIENSAEIHHLASFCLFTRDPEATVDIYHLGTFPLNCKSAVNDHYEEYVSAGFILTNLRFNPDQYSRPFGNVTYAKAELSHPEFEPFAQYLACYLVDSNYYLLVGELLSNDSEENIIYLLDSMEEIVHGFELE